MILLLELCFFCRSQMQTIITKACKELAIKEVPSKRVSKVFLVFTYRAGPEYKHRLVIH